MSLLKKTPSAAPAFIVPSLSNSLPAYAELLAKQVALQTEQSALLAERRELEKAIAADTSRELPSKVAELLGDAPRI
ncbi:hypothetical protein [Phyllobacterium zundukense]|uniref:Uncharacterized protein n=1 Tax=Phyllobacterium zundukense TaxID=1867719 RepID=A0A2N9VS48_9HYPH|nr:hypothetical protein [Phyllobacterium zundukense]ATU92739.1 hypothetical protein BLM14_14700 [Phyllobacterium zundukense]PIO42316.1 hypothetical protein B5P45_25155 [Phyllobacterium zundukense]